MEAVEKYSRDEGSYVEICKRYRIRSTKQLRDWITMYNSHKKLQDKGELYPRVKEVIELVLEEYQGEIVLNEFVGVQQMQVVV